MTEGSGYERVRNILNQAAVGSTATYQGIGPLWNLPLVDFVKVEIYGVRMIAPAPSGRAPDQPPNSPGSKSGCCHTAEATSGTDGLTPTGGAPASRGAASGLVKGLKGEPPFNGDPFPRLPWGGRPVSTEDIAFIEQWINAGCPQADEPRVSSASAVPQMADLAMGLAEHPASSSSSNRIAAAAGQRKVRKNIDSLSAEELCALRGALSEMRGHDDFVMDERSFAYWARLHATNCQHGWEEFLPWHRLYLYNFELALQDVDPSVTVPYWDWAAYHDQDQTTTTPDSGIIPAAFRCCVDDAVLAALGGKVPPATLQALRTVAGQDFNSGARLLRAAKIDYGADPAADDAIMDALMAANPLFYRLRWPGGNNSLLFEDYPAPADIDRILALDSFFDFGSGPNDNHFYGALENLHNLIHNFSGGINPNYNPSQPQQNRKDPQYGDMVAPGVTAFDPIFWCHHSNVDRLWAKWQKQHPGALPDDLDAALPPWAHSVADAMSIDRLGYEYASSVYLFPTRPDMDITRFRSAPVAAAAARPATAPGLAATRAGSHRAEVRLHGVRHLTEGGSLRIFINAPHVDETTQTRGNPCYAGQFHLFAGDCVGDEGHCAAPAGPRRPFDKRPRHRKSPGHFRLDVTPVVERLRARGDQTFHVTVAALNHAGKLASNILRLEGVGLYFLD
ncbi:MAG TPA: tyrosinase family protein [Steroidobacteraceae bacterium]